MPLRRPKLNYSEDVLPDAGQVSELAEGVFRLLMPLPIKGLDHINLWVIRDGSSWVIMDTGMASNRSKSVWESVFETLGIDTVSRVICTHLHPDHIGLAGWLCERFQAPLLMTRDEYLLARVLVADTGQEAPAEGIEFYRAAGLDARELDLYRKRFGGFGRAVYRLPQSFHRMEDNDEILIDNRRWRVIIGRGHSPEHACLWRQDDDFVVAGDQILPRISSNISVWPTEPMGNPLRDWFASCAYLRDLLPEKAFIGPAHGRPFRGAGERLDYLIQSHERALQRLREASQKSLRAVDAFPILFRKPIDDNNRLLAVGESLAHLNYLCSLGELQRRRDTNNVDIYSAI